MVALALFLFTLMKETIKNYLDKYVPSQWSREILKIPDFVKYLNELFPNVLLKDQIKSMVYGYNPYCIICDKPLRYSGNNITYTCSTECRNIHNKTNTNFIVRRKKTNSEKQHLSKMAKIRYSSPVAKPSNKVMSEETKLKISNSLIGKKQSTTTLENKKLACGIRRDQGYVSPLYGRKASVAQLAGAHKGNKKANENKILNKLKNIEELCHLHGYTILNQDDKNYNFEFECNACKTTFNYTCQGFRVSTKHGKELCPRCFPRQSIVSKMEIELREFISSIYSGKILFNDRIVLSGKEIDIYLPELNIAIELDGLYWHSEQVHPDKFNIKNKNGFAYSKGTQIIQIFEDEWKFKTDIVKSRLSHILSLKNDIKIYARRCSIVNIDSATKNNFLDSNHIQGKDVSKIRYGAYYGDLLVAVMTFKPTNMTKGGDGSVMELSRFCVKVNYSVTGIASKLLKRYKNDYSEIWPRLISYADARWSVGNLYKMLGFSYVGKSPPSYYYIINSVRHHRSNFMKHKIVDASNKANTEYEIMLSKGYDRIWDAGALKYEMET